MPSAMSSSSSSSDRDAEPFVEVDPRGRYGRYSDLLGAGAVKKVYRAFDQEGGIEVAWNQVRLRNFSDDETMFRRLLDEVRILRSLRHSSIISLHDSWIDDTSTLNFITEVCTSGNLREYRKRHRHVSVKAVKKWSRQILAGLHYLHSRNPCIIHRDLNCSNVFVNGNVGQVKIGDLGLAASVAGSSHHAHSILGTPEFMAPELYEEDYTEQVDIYSFGMCVLEMITLDIPYSECDSVAKIYRKVTAGVRPAALGKVRDPEVRAFIERCLGAPRARPSAAELLRDPFFNGIDDNAPAAGAAPAPGISCAADGNRIAPNQAADGISALRLGGAAAN